MDRLLRADEPDAGSDPAGMKTGRSRPKAATRLVGSKMWISNAPLADVFVVWAKSEAHDNAIRGFVLEKARKAFPHRRSQASSRCTHRSPAKSFSTMSRSQTTRLLPNVEGLKGPFAASTVARYGISWGALGAAEFCWHAARQYGLDRKQFQRPLAQTQLFQKKLADMQTRSRSGCRARSGSDG